MPPGNEPPAGEPRQPRGAIELTSAKYLPPGADDAAAEVARERIRDLETAPGELVFSVIGGVTGIALLVLAVFVADLPGAQQAPSGPPTVLEVARWVAAVILCVTGLYLFWRFLPRLFRFWAHFIN